MYVCVVQVDRLGPDAETRQLLAQSGIRLPCIVKPRVACGMPEAHQMAVVLHEDGFRDLEVHLCLLYTVAQPSKRVACAEAASWACCNCGIVGVVPWLYSGHTVRTVAVLQEWCLRQGCIWAYSLVSCMAGECSSSATVQTICLGCRLRASNTLPALPCCLCLGVTLGMSMPLTYHGDVGQPIKLAYVTAWGRPGCCTQTLSLISLCQPQ